MVIVVLLQARLFRSHKTLYFQLCRFTLKVRGGIGVRNFHLRSLLKP